MNLHEQYAELVRRGMPEMPRDNGFTGPSLQYDEATGQWEISDCDADCYGAELARYHDATLVRVPEQYARDLITCHALRWWCGLMMHYQAAMSAEKAWVGWHTTLGTADGKEDRKVLATAPTILAAILAATEHLREST